MVMSGSLFSNWLKLQLDNQRFPDLEWIKGSKTRFKIPWVREHHPGWETCKEIFCAWVDRDCKDQEKSRNKDVKQIFQSALHGSNYLILEEMCRQQCKSYRVYRFVSKEEGKAFKKNKSPPGNPPRFSPYRATFDCESNPESCYPGHNHLAPATIPCSEQENMLQYNFGLPTQIPCLATQQQRVQLDEHINDVHIQLGNMAYYREMNIDGNVSKLPSVDSENMEVSFSSLGITSDEMKACFLNVCYNGLEMMKTKLLPDVSSGYYVHFGKYQPELFPEEWRKKFPCFQRISLPEQDARFFDKYLASILDNTRAGLFFWYDEKEYKIKTVRFCKSHVFRVDVQSVDYMSQEAEKLTRLETYDLFSLKTLMSSHISHALVGDREPAREFFITIGVKPPPLKEDISKKGIWLNFQYLAALRYLSCQENSGSFGLPCLSTEEPEKMQCG